MAPTAAESISWTAIFGAILAALAVLTVIAARFYNILEARLLRLQTPPNPQPAP
ncbi:hypothetical protein AOQ84DRAFT_224450, partial [Glonium stellatum]